MNVYGHFRHSTSFQQYSLFVYQEDLSSTLKIILWTIKHLKTGLPTNCLTQIYRNDVKSPEQQPVSCISSILFQHRNKCDPGIKPESKGNLVRKLEFIYLVNRLCYVKETCIFKFRILCTRSLTLSIFVTYRIFFILSIFDRQIDFYCNLWMILFQI